MNLVCEKNYGSKTSLNLASLRKKAEVECRLDYDGVRGLKEGREKSPLWGTIHACLRKGNEIEAPHQGGGGSICSPEKERKGRGESTGTWGGLKGG